MYTKLFNSIVTSTIWGEDDKTRIVWITMLAICDKNGEVQASIPGLARVASVSVADCEKAIAKLSSNDPYSRTPDFNGRRIEPIDGGWAILNHAKYRHLGSKDDSKTKNAERQKRHRRSKSAHSNGTVTHSNGTVTQDRDIADTDTDTEAEAIQGVQGDLIPPPEEKPSKRFNQPTREELNVEAERLNLPSIEVDKFVAHYTSNGWMIGKNKMKSWKGALSSWALRNRSQGNKGHSNQRDPSKDPAEVRNIPPVVGQSLHDKYFGDKKT